MEALAAGALEAAGQVLAALFADGDLQVALVDVGAGSARALQQGVALPAPALVGAHRVVALLRAHHSLLALVDVHADAVNVAVTGLAVAVEGALGVDTLAPRAQLRLHAITVGCTLVNVSASAVLKDKPVVTVTPIQGLRLAVGGAESVAAHRPGGAHPDTLALDVYLALSAHEHASIVAGSGVGRPAVSDTPVSLPGVAFLAPANTHSLHKLLVLGAILHTLAVHQDLMVRTGGLRAGEGADGVGAAGARLAGLNIRPPAFVDILASLPILAELITYDDNNSFSCV